ncbi:MAG TPA: type III pantothenate kinase [Coxiellaceae bacterium]|nr:type III pantothenate kinase [Coxiellaceae bacterium]
MLLCLDVGNTHILGGVFDEEKLVTRFRYATHLIGTADQLGIFLINILNAHGIQVSDIHATAMSSVVPSFDYTVKHSLQQYFNSQSFVLQAGVKTGLNIKYKNPAEVGADRIANAIGAAHTFPKRNIIVVDLGTATTLCAVTKNLDFLGGAILPGIKLGMESLKNHTAKIMEVSIETPPTSIGRSTRESVQSGLYYGQLGALKEIITRFKHEAFNNEAVMIIGTGGFAQLYKDESVFELIIPDLVLQGLYRAYRYSTVEMAL